MAKHPRRHDETPDDADHADAPVPHEGEAPRAPDGMPEGEGNRDDAAERDMGLRDEKTMGAPPAAKATTGAETQDQKLKRLEKELAEARAAIDSLVPAAAQQALGVDPKARAKAAKGTAAAGTPEEKLPGEGPVVWSGSVEGGGPTPAFRFRGPENEAEAREHFQRHAGIKSTTGKVVVTKAASGDEARAAEAIAAAEATAAKAGKKKGK